MRLIAPSIMAHSESGRSLSSCFPTMTAGSSPFRDWHAPHKPVPGKRQSPLKGSAVIVPNPVRTLPLRSLEASSLAPGFQAWFGRDGRRMICSVYPVQPQARFKGLPDFRDALVIAVRREGEDLKAVAFLSIEPEMSTDALAPLIAESAEDAQEWHVHLPLPGARTALMHEFAALVG